MMNMIPASASMVSDVDHAGGYMRIGDLAKQFDVTLRTLRFYEDKGLLHPRRDGTTRLYSPQDVTRLKLILFGRRVGFSLREVKQMLDLYDPQGSNVRQLRTVIEKSERQLERLESQRASLEEAIDELKNATADWRDALSARQTRAMSA